MDNSSAPTSSIEIFIKEIMSTKIEPFSLVWTAVAGAIANGAEMLTLGQVLDRIKTELQRHPQLSTKQALSTIWHQDGLAGFYKGITLNLIQAGSKGFGRWGINAASDQINTHLFSESFRKHHPAAFTMSIALTAAVFDTTLTNITDRTKTFHMSTTQKHETWQQIKQRGLSFFFDAWGRTYLKQMSIWSTYQMSYGYLKRQMEKDHTPLSLAQKITLGLVPGALSAFVSTVPDLLKTQAQMKNPLNKNIFESTVMLFQRHGLKGLHSSLGIKIFRSAHYSLFTFLAMHYLNALPQNMRIK
jgi:hypothetical protein